jgi:hypothetical protein
MHKQGRFPGRLGPSGHFSLLAVGDWPRILGQNPPETEERSLGCPRPDPPPSPSVSVKREP